MMRITTRLSTFALSAALALGVAGSARAQEKIASPGPIFEERGVAIRGYDPVAYFTKGKPIVGSPKLTARHEGATYRFRTAANREAFRKDPARYTPAYGGYCAFGTSQGYKASIDPAAFTIVDDRLYLNYNAEVKAEWSKDVPGHIEKADRNWPEVKKQPQAYR